MRSILFQAVKDDFYYVNEVSVKSNYAALDKAFVSFLLNQVLREHTSEHGRINHCTVEKSSLGG